MEGGEIEGDRQKTAVDVSHHPVLVIPPAGEAGEVIKDPTLRGVEDMRAVFMNENPVLVKAVIGVVSIRFPPFLNFSIDMCLFYHTEGEKKTKKVLKFA